MSAPHIILDLLPSFCQKLSDLVEIQRSELGQEKRTNVLVLLSCVLSTFIKRILYCTNFHEYLLDV